MTARTRQLDAGVRTAMQALSAAAKKGLGDPVLAELVAIRASQLNECAFCLDMHVDIAVRTNGETAHRIALLNAWREAGAVFDDRERAALALTDAMTLLTDGYVPDEAYEAAAKHFSEQELAHLIASIVVINNWNRLMVSRRIEPGGPAW
ncbi:carboxymuconolactone decarboxylase family protein [Streptomyces sp. NBC_00006]|uniref:carboxymuconolactone decarboxylase family protein n=1 Tax=unclassified Streptomyces TaxID=2593676 RepID=UPI00225B7D94|nr:MULTISPECIES: carboxymuconolactone decarboxylase family protein [unclassified Streptomyces]MCX4828899.1 carboxymuconolactone decarboxylase family protein [Streptomyces sp. NBC_01016]MCX5531750.1 carboxymuconolactone decarboxylase family protein [Streptomyces sp. NBC_00006]